MPIVFFPAVGGMGNLVRVFRTPHVRKALVLGSGLLFSQQFCGIDTVVFYSGHLFKTAGFPVDTAVWSSDWPRHTCRRLPPDLRYHTELNLDITETDIIGRVVTECASQYRSCEACVQDTSCGFCYTNTSDGSCLPSGGETRSLVGRCNESSSTELDFKWAEEYCPSQLTWVAMLGMSIFVAAFGPGKLNSSLWLHRISPLSPGLGPMPWTINSEIFPYWARGVCSSITFCIAWGANIVVAFTFLTLTETMTIPDATFLDELTSLATEVHTKLSTTLFAPPHHLTTLILRNILDVLWHHGAGSSVYSHYAPGDQRSIAGTGGAPFQDAASGRESERHCDNCSKFGENVTSTRK
ncbi:hypothetical protein RRG08_067339 [Elysia crispata]|uniref:Uncharacterized protein n=1 Tax=Elysia crispata TaxID=231223 RepID=A0AAE1ED50_9GAST|nr:hypothetical protein RRG08_067339 [Elysia crispata]